jgi:hypothetical protein
MKKRMSIGVIALGAALGLAIAGASAFDETLYPDLKGQWTAVGIGQGAQWDPSKPPGRAQEAPLTAEYQAIYDATLARRAAAGPDAIPPTSCLPPGMPRSMMAYEPMEVIVTPDTTYVMISYLGEFRRIYTDGRDWPDDIDAAYTGYSIGQWRDSDGDGRFDVLDVETRHLKGPRTFDGSGLPLHKDNETVVKERIFLDQADPNLLRNEITTIDHALTRPWTVTRSYRREREPNWIEYVCAEDNHQVTLNGESYLVTEDGELKPTRKDQPPPDLRYFPRERK